MEIPLVVLEEGMLHDFLDAVSTKPAVTIGEEPSDQAFGDLNIN